MYRPKFFFVFFPEAMYLHCLSSLDGIFVLAPGTLKEIQFFIYSLQKVHPPDPPERGVKSYTLWGKK